MRKAKQQKISDIHAASIKNNHSRGDSGACRCCIEFAVSPVIRQFADKNRGGKDIQYAMPDVFAESMQLGSYARAGVCQLHYRLQDPAWQLPRSLFLLILAM